mmetsp:Transcript_1946/g.6520  ORF Transcript_1946/g.6520 Transcript_1946/m.6520 type:complete len:201 (-) Transcript_1946:373-975(-)
MGAILSSTDSREATFCCRPRALPRQSVSKSYAAEFADGPSWLAWPGRRRQSWSPSSPSSMMSMSWVCAYEMSWENSSRGILNPAESSEVSKVEGMPGGPCCDGGTGTTGPVGTASFCVDSMGLRSELIARLMGRFFFLQMTLTAFKGCLYAEKSQSFFSISVSRISRVVKPSGPASSSTRWMASARSYERQALEFFAAAI